MTNTEMQNIDSDLRYEIKLVCDAHRLSQARSWIRLHPAGFVPVYHPRRVNSLYLDTLSMSSFNANLEGVSVRQKLRLRWYGEETDNVQPVLELKQKRNLVGRKKQLLLPYRLDLASPWAKSIRVIRANADPEWQTLLQTMNQPVLLNWYQREYYTTFDSGIRVTLDYDQAAYDQRLLPRPNLRTRLPIADVVVIEIKTSLEHIERLQEIASQFPLLRSRNSKYVRNLLTALS